MRDIELDGKSMTLQDIMSIGKIPINKSDNLIKLLLKIKLLLMFLAKMEMAE